MTMPKHFAFYSSTTGMLATAHDSGANYATRAARAEWTRAQLAKQTIASALLGERNQRRLYDGALRHLASTHHRT